MNRQTPLFSWHRSHGAKLGPFAGWDMPMQYHTGALEEHHLVRRSAGLFDISHMGRVRVHGSDAGRFLQRLVTADVEAVGSNGSTYGLLCRSDGTTIDDLFIYRDADGYFVVTNASNHERDLQWMGQYLSEMTVDATIDDVSSDTAGIALQGPDAIRIADLLGKATIGSIPRFGCSHVEINGRPVFVGRTGYTGEDGVEFFPASVDAEALWNRVFEVAAECDIEVGPCGLASRDSLRFEPGFHLYGHELDDTITPIEARLKWACALGTDFVGRDALEMQLNNGVTRRLCTFVMSDRAVPRQGYDVLDAGNAHIGSVASGMFAPTVGKYAGNAYVPTEHSKPGTQLTIDVRGRKKAARVVKRPLYKPAYKA